LLDQILCPVLTGARQPLGHRRQRGRLGRRIGAVDAAVIAGKDLLVLLVSATRNSRIVLELGATALVGSVHKAKDEYEPRDGRDPDEDPPEELGDHANDDQDYERRTDV
jgi:hypothetical protein